MESLRNFALGDTRYRVGQDKFTSLSFYDLAHQCLGKTQAFAMFLSYGEDFLRHVEAQGWRVKGWGGAPPAWFTDFPVDFDASENLPLALRDVKQFIQDELIAKGIDKRYFVVYLSGGKGFHVHISASVLNAPQPLANAGYRIGALAKGWGAKYPTLDVSIYDTTRLFRLPGSKHKSGLHKVEIALEDLTLEHIENRHRWAAEAPKTLRIPELGAPPVTLDLPAYVPTSNMASHDVVSDFDPDAKITPNCPWLQKVLADPTNGGNDGKGREKRRNAIGVLLSAHETSESNPELKWYIEELERHPYMDAKRMGEVYKWVREYDRDGEIKCKKACHALGCSSPQRKYCGTKSPLDWKLKQRELVTLGVDEARAANSVTLSNILQTDGNGVYVLPWPVGIGKTYTLMQQVAQQGLTAFYASSTHALALQTHHDFTARGLNSRHVASRGYLAENMDFECLALDEVGLALANGYEAVSVCGKCPRFPKKVKGEWQAQDTNFEPCDYYLQFDGLDKADAVCGVHQHLYEHMYEQADLANRSITVIDESPFAALANEYAPLESGKLALINSTLDKMLERKEVAPKPVTPQLGIFGAARVVVQAALEALDETEDARRRRVLENVRDAFQGKPIDRAWLEQMAPEQLKAIWYDLASQIGRISGLSDNLPLEVEYLAIPNVLQAALKLLSLGKVYDPIISQYLPIELPPNKLIILDATASSDVYAEVVSRYSQGLRHYEYVQHALVEQPHSHVTQITTASYGVAALQNEATMTRLALLVDKLTKKHPGKSLIVCHKQHADLWRKMFAKRPEIEVAHFGSLKGLNRWADCVAQYIIGTPFVPDSAICELGNRLGNEIPLGQLADTAKLKRILLLAKDGSTCVVNRRTFESRFHSELAKMYGQFEVTQAVRLRLYDQSNEEKQHLYIFSNVELKGMYADTYTTTSDLIVSLSKGEQDTELAELKTELKGALYAELNAWLESLPTGATFKAASVPEGLGAKRSVREWLLMAAGAGWLRRPAAHTYVKADA